MIKQFIFNALNSWLTSGAGAVWGGPKIWEGIKGLFDSDASTGMVWPVFWSGLGILVTLLMARDWTKGFFKSKRLPDAPIDFGG